MSNAGYSFDEVSPLAAWTLGNFAVSIVGGRTSNGASVGGVSFLGTGASGATVRVGVAWNFGAYAASLGLISDHPSGNFSFGFSHVGDGRILPSVSTLLGADTLTPLAMNFHTGVWYYFEFGVENYGQAVLTNTPSTDLVTIAFSYYLLVNDRPVLRNNYSRISIVSHPAVLTSPNAVVFSGPGGGNSSVLDDVYVGSALLGDSIVNSSDIVIPGG